MIGDNSEDENLTVVCRAQDVNGVTMFPQSEYGFATSSDDKTCRLWDMRADQPIAVYGDEALNVRLHLRAPYCIVLIIDLCILLLL